MIIIKNSVFKVGVFINGIVIEEKLILVFRKRVVKELDIKILSGKYYFICFLGIVWLYVLFFFSCFRIVFRFCI